MKKVFLSTTVLGALIFIYFNKASTFSGFWITGDLGYSDICDLNWPIKCFLYQKLADGRLPLWTKDILCGLPLLAEGEGGFFYPINLLLFLLFKPFYAYNLSILITFLVAGISIWLFCRSIGMGTICSTSSSIIFCFCGFFICHLKHPAMIMTASLFPCLFYLAERFIKDGKLSLSIVAGIIFGLQILAGHPQIVVYTNIALVLYFVFRFTQFSLSVLKERRRKRRKPLAIILARTYFLPLMAVIGLSISAIQLLPTLELLEHSGRRIGGAIHELYRFPFHPKELVRFILPYFYGDPYLANHKTPWDGLFWENTAYIGILPLALSLFAIFKIKRDRYILFFTLLLILSLLLSFGKFSPFFFLLKLPPLSTYRFPNRFLLIADFSLAVLSGFGMQYLLARIKKRNVSAVVGIIMISLIFIDLLKFGHHHNPTAPAKDWLRPPDSVIFLKEDPDLFRIYSVGTIITRNHLYYKYGWKDPTPYIQHREVLSPNTNLEHQLSSPSIYLTLFPLRPYIFEMEIGGGISLNSADYTAEIPPHILKLLRLLNVKYIISVFSIEGLSLVKEIDLNWQLPSVKIYRNSGFFERAYIVPKPFFVDDPNEIVDILCKDWFDPKKRVILEEKAPKGSESVEGSSCRVLEYEDDRVKIEADVTADCFLVLTDSNYPGWKCYVDGKEEKIYYANLAFRAVFLKEGKHTVEFVYSPDSFKKGAVITLFALFAVFIYLGYRRVVLRSKR